MLDFGYGEMPEYKVETLHGRKSSGHLVTVCSPFLVSSSGAVHCFELAAKLMFQNGAS